MATKLTDLLTARPADRMGTLTRIHRYDFGAEVVREPIGETLPVRRLRDGIIKSCACLLDGTPTTLTGPMAFLGQYTDTLIGVLPRPGQKLNGLTANVLFADLALAQSLVDFQKGTPGQLLTALRNEGPEVDVVVLGCSAGLALVSVRTTGVVVPVSAAVPVPTTPIRMSEFAEVVCHLLGSVPMPVGIAPVQVAVEFGLEVAASLGGLSAIPPLRRAYATVCERLGRGQPGLDRKAA